MRDINGAELHEASDGELAALVNDMSLGQTWETRQLAQTELDRREAATLAPFLPFVGETAAV